MKLIVFYADWCGPCKIYQPIYEEFCKNNNIELERVNVDKEGNKYSELEVRSLPTTAVIVNGEVKMVQTGVLHIGDLKELIK